MWHQTGWSACHVHDRILHVGLMEPWRLCISFRSCGLFRPLGQRFPSTDQDYRSKNNHSYHPKRCRLWRKKALPLDILVALHAVRHLMWNYAVLGVLDTHSYVWGTYNGVNRLRGILWELHRQTVNVWTVIHVNKGVICSTGQHLRAPGRICGPNYGQHLAVFKIADCGFTYWKHSTDRIDMHVSMFRQRWKLTGVNFYR